MLETRGNVLETRGKEMTLQLKSFAFSSGGAIPVQYTCDQADISPSLAWNDPPAGTKSFALIADDPDAPKGTWVHWVIYNISTDSRVLAENIPKNDPLPNGIRQGINDFRKIGYGGPCPPPGKPHRYFFRLYALDTIIALPAGGTKKNLEKAMAGHILANTELMGTYKR